MVEESESLGSIGAIGMADSAPSYDSAQSAPTPSAAAIAQLTLHLKRPTSPFCLTTRWPHR